MDNEQTAPEQQNEDAHDYAVADEITDILMRDAERQERPRDETGRFTTKNQPEESEAAPAEEADAEEDAAPAEEQPSGDEEAQDEPEATPPIDPPHSWTKEQREAWNALTPQAKQIVLERETARDAEVRRSQNEAAEFRKRYESEAEAVKQAGQKYAEGLQTILQYHQTLDPVLQDWAKANQSNLAETDPAAYVALQAKATQRMSVLQAVMQEQQRLSEQQRAEARSTYEKRLKEVFPDFADPTKGSELLKAWTPHLLANGFTQAEVDQTRDIPWDPRVLKAFGQLAEKASKWDAFQAAKKTLPEKKVAQPAPKIAKPKGQEDGKQNYSKRVDALSKRAAKTDSVRDMADFITAALEEG